MWVISSDLGKAFYFRPAIWFYVYIFSHVWKGINRKVINSAARIFSSKRSDFKSAMEKGFPPRFELQEQIGKLVYRAELRESCSVVCCSLWAKLGITLIRLFALSCFDDFLSSRLTILMVCFLYCCHKLDRVIQNCNVVAEVHSVLFEDASTRGAIEFVLWKLLMWQRWLLQVASQKKVGSYIS